MLDLYRECWHAELEAEQEHQTIAWEEELPPRLAFELGRQAIGLAMAELIPHLGDPVDVRRRLEFTLAPGLEWTILCYVDLETLKEREGEDPAPTIVDFKVKGSLIYQDRADADPQAGLYLAGRWLEGYPANEPLFAQIAKPGKRRREMSTSLVRTTRTTGQHAVVRCGTGVSDRAGCGAAAECSSGSRSGKRQPVSSAGIGAGDHRGGGVRGLGGRKLHGASAWG